MTSLFKPDDVFSFTELMGVEFTIWKENEAELKVEILGHHLNRANVVHGGVVAAMLDNAATFCAIWCPDPDRKRQCVTLSLNCNFIGQAGLGDTLIATGRVRGGGRKIKFVDAEVHNQNGDLIGKGEAVIRYRTGSENLEGIPK